MGEWLDGRQEGKGTMYSSSGEVVKKGIWK